MRAFFLRGPTLLLGPLAHLDHSQQFIFLLSLAPSHSIGVLQALSRLGCPSPVLSLFFLTTFRAQSGPSICPIPRSRFRSVSSGFLLALFRTRSSCDLCDLFSSASLVLFLFLPVRVLSLSLHALLLALSQPALGFLVGAVIAEASFPAVRSLPSAPSLSSSSLSSYSSSSSPHFSLRATGVCGVTASAVFSAMLLWLHP